MVVRGYFVSIKKFIYRYWKFEVTYRILYYSWLNINYLAMVLPMNIVIYLSTTSIV